MRPFLSIISIYLLVLGLLPGFHGSTIAAPAEASDGKPFVTHHQIVINGPRISYTAIAGAVPLTNSAGERTGSLFSFTYLKDKSSHSSRPVLFIFNGGPGSSSVWLHMGVMGPRRVALKPEINPSTVPPFDVVNNPYCPLDVADLVFIDPIGTGFSQIIEHGKAEDFYGVDEDASATAQFIEHWLTKYDRWNSPKFLMGESYGSIRAAVLPRALMGGPTYTGLMRGITINGIILLGTTLEARDSPDSTQAFWDTAMALPAMAATAWYHGKINRQGRTLASFNDEVIHFAETDYVKGLQKAKQHTLPPSERAKLIGKLAQYTGLPEKIFDNDLQLSPQQFSNQLLANKGLSIGLYDSRYTLPAHQSGNDPVADDPAMAQYVPGFIAAFHQVLRNDLNVTLEQSYSAITWQGLLNKWRWERAQVPPGQSFAIDLAVAMRRNSKLRILVASGYYDLATTAASAHHTLKKANLPADRVVYKMYESGHMLYLGNTAQSFANDVRALIQSAIH